MVMSRSDKVRYAYLGTLFVLAIVLWQTTSSESSLDTVALERPFGMFGPIISTRDSIVARAKWKASDFFSDPRSLEICEKISTGANLELAGADAEVVNKQERHGLTVLHWAFLEGDVSAFSELLDLGANPQLRFTEDVKEDYVVFQAGSTLLFDMLHRRGYGQKFFEAAVEHVDDFDSRNEIYDRGTLLHAYIQSSFGLSNDRSLATIERMVTLGFDPNARDRAGKTPCMVAVGYAMPSECLLMLQMGADPSVRNNAGEDLRDVIAHKLTVGSPTAANGEDRSEEFRQLQNWLGMLPSETSAE